MAPTLTSKSFFLTPTTTTTTRLTQPRFTVFAKKSGDTIFQNFGLTKKTKDDDGSPQPAATAAFNPFKFDRTKFPDIQSLVPVAAINPASLTIGNTRRKDTNTVFVAGATGQAGVRIVHKLLRQGFVVRAGVPDLAAAQDLARLAATYKVI